MIKKVLNETSVTPKITLTQTEYNRLVELAQANALRYEQRAHREWVVSRTLTLTGWLLAVLMLIYVILK